MTYTSNANCGCYFPPLLSNGRISFAPDAEGMLGYTVQEYLDKGITAFDGIVVRAARRTGLCNGLNARLFPFGAFRFREGSALGRWEQSLIPERGVVESNCQYADGTEICSEGFIHPEQNLYCLRKIFRNVNGTKQVCYTISLEGYNPKISEYMQVLYTKQQGTSCRIGFRMYGMDVFRGEIRVFVDKAYNAALTENGVEISFNVSEDEAVCFYYAVEDNYKGTDYDAVLNAWEEKVGKVGYSGLLTECEDHFRAYYDLGYVKTSDEKLNRIYKTALYGVKCSTTDYSIAVGLNNGSWDGRFFAFDEFTSYLGLLSSGRKELAKRVPMYRMHCCLDGAIQRASDCHRTPETEDMARFHWESGEVDKRELSPDGTWQDHIFHIPLVGIGAFQYYEYTGDVEFLQEAYRMIRACAKFITKHMLYRDGDRLYIGKCTDLERLGASVENPFLTVCGAVAMLRCCAKAAEVLKTDLEYAWQCREIADKLQENLPVENEMYVPHLECKQKSIAMFGGKFPFPILEDRDGKMLRAWQDFEENGGAYGNMYPKGKHISPWYACWKAVAYARAKLSEKAYDALRQAYLSVGVFDEMFEINEADVHLRPWFTTAAGIFLVAVNDMLLQVEGNEVHLMPGIPLSVDASFKLAAPGGITVEAEIVGGKILRGTVWKNGMDVTGEYKVRLGG